MNPLKAFCLVACLLAAASASPMSQRNSLKPADWLSVSELKEMPSLEEMSMNRLDRMPMEEGAKLVNKMYHLAKVNDDLKDNYQPRAEEITVSIYKPNRPKVVTTLDKLPSKAKEIDNFGTEEVTVFITGLPKELKDNKKAIHKLINNYMQRYAQQQQELVLKNSEERTSVERDQPQWRLTSVKTSPNSGTLVVIELGEKITDMVTMATLDTLSTGHMIGEIFHKLTKDCVRREDLKIVAQGIAAHVAGAAARQYTRCTGNKLPKIIALDPSKIFASNSKTLVGLTRGDAKFVQAIHTTPYGLGTVARVGNVDFYVNGPSRGVPGAKSVVDACARAVRYYAETVIPGNETNFPSVAANSLRQYENNNGYGRRTHMGIATEVDVEGDYILKVNEQSPFGRQTPARKQNGYHGIHKSWNTERDFE